MVPHHEPLTSSPNVRTGPVMFLSVLSCRYGGGHQRVAETIAAEWTAATGGRADVVDYFARFTSPTFDALTRFWYYQAIRYTPAVQDRFYQYMGRIRPDSRFRRAVNRQGMGRLARYLERERPDVVCCVHWTFAGTMSDLRAAGRTAVPCLTVITDYVSHGEWLHPHVDRYAVPHDAMAEGLRAWGLPADRVVVSGLPIERKYARPLDRAALRARFGLVEDRPVVLVMAGAYAALGRIDDVARVLARGSRPLQIIVVCANADRLARRVRAIAAGSPHAWRVLGWVDNVDELMAASDLLVTKAGGVTVSEALATGLPMVFYGSIPGQEESNGRFITAQGAALSARTPDELHRALAALLADPERRAELRRAAHGLARPEAARVVVTHLAALAAGGRPTSLAEARAT